MRSTMQKICGRCGIFEVDAVDAVFSQDPCAYCLYDQRVEKKLQYFILLHSAKSRVCAMSIRAEKC